jgi:exodeoxyribonuclease V alpha subunit
MSLLSGYGGTGKTAVLKAVYDISIEMGIPVHVAALAGKAANRAKQSANIEDGKASTIHTMIKLIEEKSKFGVDIYSDPLIIIDESSMVDISLICKLIRLFWHKLVESIAPHTRLTDDHRMAVGSSLHECAMKIRNGVEHQLQVYQGEAEGVYIMPNVNDYSATIVKLRKKFENIMVLTSYSSKNFHSSTSILNPVIQAKTNPLNDGEHSLHYDTTVLHKNDPVLATKNDHKLGIFNGMTGVINQIHIDNGKLVCFVQFDGEPFAKLLSPEDCWEVGLQLAYLITVHKSQGSEYTNTAIFMDSPYIERSGLYTALTRTKKLCILIGTNEQYNRAIKRPPSFEGIRSGFNPVFK